VTHPEIDNAKTKTIIVINVFIKSPYCEINRFLAKTQTVPLKTGNRIIVKLCETSRKIDLDLLAGHYGTKTSQNQSGGAKKIALGAQIKQCFSPTVPTAFSTTIGMLGVGCFLAGKINTAPYSGAGDDPKP
jgi:hypothetical protein